MKANQKYRLIPVYLLCLFLLQATGLGAQNNGKPNRVAAELESNDPLFYFERIEFWSMSNYGGPINYYTLYSDGDLIIHMHKKVSVELPDQLFLFLLMQNRENPSEEPLLTNIPVNRAGIAWDGLELFEARFPINELNKVNPKTKAGLHAILACISDNMMFMPPFFYNIAQLDIRDYAPITEQPVIDDLYLTPSSFYAGQNSNLNVWFHARFSSYEQFNMVKQVKLSLYYTGENEQPVLLRETTSTNLNSNNNNYSVGPSIDFSSIDFMAGKYTIKMDFNPNTPNEGDYVFTLTEFDVPKPPNLASTKLVHTDYGLYKTTQIGNQDTIDLILEGWNKKLSDPILIRDNIVIGSPGWDSNSYRLKDYTTINSPSGNSALTINMAYKENNPSVTYPIEPGNYFLAISTYGDTGYNTTYVTTPITIIDGKTQITPTLTSIEVATSPYRTIYKNGDRLDLEGMTVRALYDLTQGGRMITDYTTTPVDGSVLTPENSSGTINYTEKGISKSTALPIKVAAADSWVVHQFYKDERDSPTVIYPGSGNHIFRGIYQSNPVAQNLVDLFHETPITVKSGYSGIIRFEGTKIDVSGINIKGMYIEPNTEVILELIGSNTLLAGYKNGYYPGYYDGITVEDGAGLIIDSDCRGSLKVSANTGISVSGANSGGKLIIRGNAIVDASGNDAFYGNGIYCGFYMMSNSMVIITDNAEVNASGFGYSGAGIGGASGPGSINGTLLIKGNAIVKAYSKYGAALGGGSNDHTGGDGGIITIGGNARVTAISDGSTAIGGGRGGYNGRGGNGGIITIQDNACVTTIADGLYACGIGGGPNYYTRGFQGGDIRITGGTINAVSIGSIYDRGNAISGTAKITGGSIYNSLGAVSAVSTDPTPKSLYKAKLIVRDENGKVLDHIRLRLDNNYDLETGNNLVWDGSTFSNELQHGVAYAWLPSGARTVEILNAKGDFSPKSINVQNNNDGEFTITLQRGVSTLAWNGSVDNDWNNPANWSPAGVPDANTVVTIPGNAAKFPILVVDPNPSAAMSVAFGPGAPGDGGDTQPPAPAVASEIHFAPGAELGRQDFLTYDKAFVQLDFSDKLKSRGRWWMLTNPLQQLFAADFSFGGLPAVAIQEYVTDPVSKSSVWKSLAGTNREIVPGAGFEIWLTNGDFDNSGINKGLNTSGGIITLPYFETFEEQAVHYTQSYDPVTFVSTYYGNANFVRTGTPLVSVTRDPDKAYKLVGVDANKVFTANLDFGKGAQGKSYFAATGNPFMSSISFEKLQQTNASMITENYWIWVGAGSNNAVPGSYVSYNITAGTVGKYDADYLSDALPPMQSFIVERNATETGNQIKFKIATISATGQNAGAGLRAAALSNDLLEMIASTPQASVRAVIASREDGSPVFNPKDSRKMFTEINTLPDLYTLKPDADKNMTPVAANVLNEITRDIVIPVGISTTYEGSITISFAGMDTYNARIFFIDNEASKSIELTGKAKYEYTFNYAPAKVNGTVTSNEARFSIRMSPTNATGIESVPGTVLVYSRSAGTIQAVSGDPILQIAVYDIQGREIYGNASVNARETTVSGLAANVYVVKVVTAGGVKTTKVIVR